MPQQLSDIQLQEMATQLRCPTGEAGIEVGQLMNASNAAMIAAAIAALALKDGDTVLELGPGNGSHVKSILNRANAVSYIGLDISATMVAEAQKLNKGLSNTSFLLYDGDFLPFHTGTFNQLFTTNTIYFWKYPQAYAEEIARVLTVNGLAVVGFIPKRVMQKIPFAKYGFTMYSEDDVVQLLEDVGLKFVSQTIQNEFMSGLSGQGIEREFVITTFKKV
jgi:ubiquinone/menaquinone biosynthesis C-methylase UbiE